VTAHISIPIDEILESQAELARKRRATAKILWVSWRHVVALAHQATGDLMLHDLERVLRRLGLTFFEGVGPVFPPLPISWSFERLRAPFEWSVEPIEVLWHFSGMQRG
jgi:hypothetical protein